jgi:ABC-type uncharacterized transport system substrate-binding protein
MAFATFSQQRVGAVLFTSSPLYTSRMEQLAALAGHHALPTIYAFREFALAGGLISYGSNLGYMNHQLGIYTGRILKGEKPADMPVEQASKPELVINLKTAKALSLTTRKRCWPLPMRSFNETTDVRRGARECGGVADGGARAAGGGAGDRVPQPPIR